jgi:DNA invertase Pin-like site-specific DNA recombinase
VSVFALLVVSSDLQAETLRHQRAWAVECARAHGWQITRTFEDVSSGRIGVRAPAKSLLSEIKSLDVKDRPRYVLMIRLDRLGRGDAIASQIYVRELRSLGVRVWTRDQGEVHLDTAMEQMAVGMQAFFAQHENEVRSDKAKAVYKRKRESGEAVGNQRAYGLKLDGHRDVPDEPRAQVVARAITALGSPYRFSLRRRYSEMATNEKSVGPPAE